MILLLEGEEYDVPRLGIHRLGRVDKASWAPHSHVELGSSHLDHGNRKESRKLENVGKDHVVKTGG